MAVAPPACTAVSQRSLRRPNWLESGVWTPTGDLMPIPTFDVMLRPLLEIAAARPLTRAEGSEAMERHFSLTDDERARRIPSGSSTYVRNRVGWAMTHLTKAGLIAKVAPRVYNATDEGRAFL